MKIAVFVYTDGNGTLRSLAYTEEFYQSEAFAEKLWTDLCLPADEFDPNVNVWDLLADQEDVTDCDVHEHEVG
jgi:hypothetical protein